MASLHHIADTVYDIEEMEERRKDPNNSNLGKSSELSELIFHHIYIYFFWLFLMVALRIKYDTYMILKTGNKT